MCYINQILLHHIKLKLLILIPYLHHFKITYSVRESMLQLLILHHSFSYEDVHINDLLF